MTSFQWWADQLPPNHFICCLCFEEKDYEQAWRDSRGFLWDNCQDCGQKEQRALEQRGD